MLNEDKIKLMTGIAMFEKREGKKIFPVNRYFQSDYISRHMFRSFFSYTICYLLCAVTWVLYHMEQLLNTLDISEVVGTGKYAVFLYVSGLVFYLAVTWLVYRKRYEYARRGMKIYVAKLKRLEKRYEFQNRARELLKEGSRHDRASRN
ncbi:hypothetical protein D3Z51_04810 [Clostridiaceae bacterium]|nr:hypothetical protein [Clostridiaceae bacterium]RKI15819.1 hypothetical protein D7V81_05795 [bacterium 1XD21-70]